MIGKLKYPIFTLFVFGFLFIGNVLAQIRLPGVLQGNQFIYDVSSSWSSVDPTAEIPPKLVEANMTDSYTVTITAVSGSEVSIHTTWRFINGTEIEADNKVNVEIGMPSGGFWTIIAANLGANDRIHPRGPDQYTINQTITRNYPNGPRETNLLQLVFEYYDADDPTMSTTMTEYTTTYFDRATGILVELKDESVYTNPDRRAVILWKIKDSNVWVVPEFPSIVFLIVLMVAVLISAIVYKKAIKKSN